LDGNHGDSDSDSDSNNSSDNDIDIDVDRDNDMHSYVATSPSLVADMGNLNKRAAGAICRRRPKHQDEHQELGTSMNRSSSPGKQYPRIADSRQKQ
jgi:hypothetical protein